MKSSWVLPKLGNNTPVVHPGYPILQQCKHASSPHRHLQALGAQEVHAKDQHKGSNSWIWIWLAGRLAASAAIMHKHAAGGVQFCISSSISNEKTLHRHSAERARQATIGKDSMQSVPKVAWAKMDTDICICVYKYIYIYREREQEDQQYVYRYINQTWHVYIPHLILVSASLYEKTYIYIYTYMRV